MTVIIAGQELVWLCDAASKADLPYITLYSHVMRHPKFYRARLGRLIFVRLQDVMEYKKRMR